MCLAASTACGGVRQRGGGGGRDVKLSKKEQAELEYKKEVLRLAKEKRKYLEDIEDKDVYRMPDSYDAEGTNRSDKRYEVLTARYKCAYPCSAAPHPSHHTARVLPWSP